MDQEILPCVQGRIDTVKINPSLLMMRERIVHCRRKGHCTMYSAPSFYITITIIITNGPKLDSRVGSKLWGCLDAMMMLRTY